MEIRDFVPSDYAGVCGVINSSRPDYATSIEELKHEDRVITGNGYFLKRYVATGSEERIVGFGDLSERVERYQPGKLHLDIEVDRGFRRTGLWDALFERLENTAVEREASLLTARGSSIDGFTISRLRAKGFKVASRDIESRLDLRNLSQEDLERSIARTGDRGIIYTTLGAEKVSDQNFARKLRRMENRAGRDVPSTDRWRRMSLSEYVDLVHRSPRVIDDAWQIAKYEGRCVGESFLQKGGGYPRFLSTGFTCVIQEFRRRGIAEGLKLRALLWAKKHGVQFVKTWNDSTNTPILQLNRKLGFRRYAVWFKLEKRLQV